jgi:hypothetical protein
MSCRLTRSTKKAHHHTRSVQLPRGYVPLHFLGNQRSGRRTAAQGACNRPAVVRPFIFAETSGRKGACNRHVGSVQPPHGCAPPQLRCNRRPNMGAQAHMSMQPARRLPSAEKSHRRSRQCHVFSGPSRRTEKISF